MILMQHPDLGPEHRQTVPEKAFKLVWEKQGWYAVEDSDESDSQVLENTDYPAEESEEEE